VGFTLFFGVLDVIHFSHGDIFMLGAFAGLSLTFAWAMAGLAHPVVALPLTLAGAVLLTGLVGVAAERACVRPLAKAPPLMTLLATLSLGLVIREAVLIFYPRGADPKPFPTMLPAGGFEVGGVVVRYENLAILAIGAGAMVAVDLVINRTRIGAGMRAVAQDPEAAQMMGVDVDRIVLLTFFLGSALAGAGSLFFGFYYGFTGFYIGYQTGLRAFTSAVLGGIGNIPGAVVGGLVIGLIQSLGGQLLEVRWTDVIIFSILIVVLVFRPAGILGMQTPQKA
jgi:branched-chain amino acid transport system permease protein